MPLRCCRLCMYVPMRSAKQASGGYLWPSSFGLPVKTRSRLYLRSRLQHGCANQIGHPAAIPQTSGYAGWVRGGVTLKLCVNTHSSGPGRFVVDLPCLADIYRPRKCPSFAPHSFFPAVHVCLGCGGICSGYCTCQVLSISQ